MIHELLYQMIQVMSVGPEIAAAAGQTAQSQSQSAAVVPTGTPAGWAHTAVDGLQKRAMGLFGEW